MNILITGGNGFIAREMIIALQSQGHDLTVCVRQLTTCVMEDDKTRYIQADFTNNTQKEQWLSRLENIDVVINCVGVFQTTSEKEMWAIHHDAPRALFDACVEKSIKKIIHISALGVDKSDVAYAKSKFAIENYLQALPIDSTIIRPSFVYGHGSYGGSSLFRGLAGLPFVIVLPGSGEQLLQPVHVNDLVSIVVKSISLPGKQLLCAAGAEKISLKDILIKLRAWLGFKKALLISMPLLFIRIAAIFGDFFRNSPLSTTGVKLMVMDNVVNDAEFTTLTQTIGFTPRSFSDGLRSMVSGVQDRWHARLFFLRPVLRLSIAFLWIFTAIVSVFNTTDSYALLTQAGISHFSQSILLYGASALDFILGVCVLCNYRLFLVGVIQIIVTLIFTLIISIQLPEYWLHPFGPLAKNIPLIFATLVMMALWSDR